MITSALIYIAATIANLILAIFPASEGLPSEYTTAISTVSGYVGMLDPLVPINTLIQVLLIVLSYEFIVFSFKAISWTYHKIPIIGK